MKYAHIDENNGKILGWYSDDIHGVLIQAEVDENGKLLKDEYYDVSKIPTPNIEVNETVWKKAIEINANAYDKDKKTFVVKDFRTDDEIEKDAEYESKVKKESELNLLQVSLNNVSYDAHMEAMGNMGIVTAVASFEMWKAWASLSAENLAVYNAVFKQTIEWKGATNEKHVVQIESVAETAKKAMGAKAEILFKY